MGGLVLGRSRDCVTRLPKRYVIGASTAMGLGGALLVFDKKFSFLKYTQKHDRTPLVPGAMNARPSDRGIFLGLHALGARVPLVHGKRAQPERQSHLRDEAMSAASARVCAWVVGSRGGRVV